MTYEHAGAITFHAFVPAAHSTQRRASLKQLHTTTTSHQTVTDHGVTMRELPGISESPMQA